VSVRAAGTFLGPGSGSAVAQSALLGGLFVLAALPSGVVWLAFGATVQQQLPGRRALRAFNLVLGGLLALSVALIVR
jgi:threonine/homoserine/homoserine lactone efflux protein